MSVTVGWLAHWREMVADANLRIGRPRQLFVGAARRDVVPMAQR
jgi:citrate synthase